MGFLRLLGLWLLAIVMLGSAVVFGWVTIKTHSISTVVGQRSRQERDDDLVRLACADLDAEYRRLLQR